jgi:hypothetical protein
MRDARTLAREVLAMDVEGYRAAFRGSPMKRAKLPAMRRGRGARQRRRAPPGDAVDAPPAPVTAVARRLLQ